jgi:hypothetical protein
MQLMISASLYNEGSILRKADVVKGSSWNFSHCMNL